MKTKFKIVAISCILALTGSLLLSGCYTTKGVGKDVQKGGEAIQRAATPTY